MPNNMENNKIKDISMASTDDKLILENLPLAFAYVPMQKAGAIFPPEKGLEEGTIFPELVSPYKGEVMFNFARTEEEADGNE